MDASTNSLSKVEERRLAQFIGITAGFVTLAISPFSSYDPINPIKNLILVTGAGLALGLLLSTRGRFLKSLSKAEVFIFTGFFLALINPLIFSDSDLGQQLFGIFGRNNGFISYVGILILTLGAASIKSFAGYRFVIYIFCVTLLPESIYALIQIYGKDPVAWSSFAPFGTLGNVNFISAFLGMGFIVTFGMLSNVENPRSLKIALVVLLLSISVVLAKCGSSQGYFIVLAGILTFSLYLVLTKVKNRKIFLASLVGTFFIVVEGIRAFFNSGFLAQYIYQPTITFRFDYMHAGFSMLQSHPLTGVGLDSFDDYYRGERGVISALRTGPNRIANTAHNLAMDLGANGGYPLLIAWVAIQILALISILRFLRRNKEFDWLVGTLISVWIGYLLQSLISINQIGTSVWGWIVTGCLIGLSRILRVDEKSRSRNNSRPKNRNVKGPKNSVENLLRPSAAALTVIVGLAGFSCAYPTYSADKKFKTAMTQGDLSKMASTAVGIGGNAWLLSQTIQAFGRAGDVARAKKFAELMSDRYPRNFYSWQVINRLENASAAERNAAYDKLKYLDPYNPCFSQDSIAVVKDWLKSLSQAKQNEIVSFWNIPSLAAVQPLHLKEPWQRVVTASEFDTRVARFCNDG